MNSNIFGKKEVITRAMNAQPGDRSVYINWDAIESLPDEYEVQVTEIRYDPSRLDIDFADIGNDQYMPTPKLMYKIADACGINGGEESKTEPIIEEVDINPMLMRPLEDAPTIRKMTVGRRVVKYATRLQEDGTVLRSSPCTVEYNVFDRCCELWAKEEVYTDSYTKQSKYPPKYNTPAKRKLHFASEMKFAHAKAETKAHEKAIRELSCLQTGYAKSTLTSGSLVFAKVRRSRKILQAETAARLAAMSKGQQQAETRLLFDDTQQAQPAAEQSPAETVDGFPGTTEIKQAEIVKDNRTILLETFIAYQTEGLVKEESKETVSNVIKWLDATEDAESKASLWDKAITIIKQIEAIIPQEARIDHGF